MTATFRPVYFIPDPFLDGRIAIAALVRTSDGMRVARASLLPDVECLGRRSAHTLLHMILDGLHDARDLTALPPSVGPDAFLGEERVLPASVRDPVEWVQRHVLPRRSDDDANDEEGAPPSRVRRATEGLRLLAALDVARYVKHSFRPSDQWSAILPAARELFPVSHYVSGREHLLLMEPVVVRSRHYEDELRHLATNFLAYRYVIEHSSYRLATQLLAYVMPGGSENDRQGAYRAMLDKAHIVLDVTMSADRERLRDEVRRTAEPPLVS